MTTEESRLWRGVFDNSSFGVAVSALDGRLLSANIHLQRMLGYSENALLALSFLDFTHPDDLEATRKALQALGAGNVEQYRMEKRCRRADGTYIWTETSLSCIPDTAGRPEVLTGVVADITERKQAEGALKLLVNVTADASAAPDIPSMATSCLHCLCEARQWELGQAWYPSHDGSTLTCSPDWVAMTPGFDSFHATSLATPLSMGRGLPGRVWASKAAAWVVDVGDDVNFPRMEAGRRAGFKAAFGFPVMLGEEVLAVFEFFSRDLKPPDPPFLDTVQKLGRHLGDTFARKRQAEALQNARSALANVSRLTTMGALTASIAHEVNQPLAAIVANAGASRRWLAMTPPNLDEARATLQAIADNGTRASEVIGRARRMLQRAPPGRQALGINAVIVESLVFVEGEVARWHVSMERELAPDLPTVTADRVEIQQALVNLFLNGIEAMEPVTTRPRTLTIRTAPDADGVAVTILDSGTGMDPAVRSRLFEAFVSSKPNGLGLGLCITRSIVESHGGRIALVEREGPGAAFRFTLPRIPPGTN